jgi:hypothetical protein
MPLDNGNSSKRDKGQRENNTNRNGKKFRLKKQSTKPIEILAEIGTWISTSIPIGTEREGKKRKCRKCCDYRVQR